MWRLCDEPHKTIHKWHIAEETVWPQKHFIWKNTWKKHTNNNSYIPRGFFLGEIYFWVTTKFLFVLFLCFMSFIWGQSFAFLPVWHLYTRSSIQLPSRQIQNKILLLNDILIQLQQSWTKRACWCILVKENWKKF